jgi:hypothetical protein
MSRGTRWFYGLGALIIGLGAILFVTSFIGANYLVDIWWFDSLGYGFYYWQRLLYRYVIFGLVTLLFFLIFFLNFWVASRYLGTSFTPTSPLRPSSIQAYKDLLKMFRTGSMRVYTPLSLILAVPVALPLFRQWEAFLLYVFAPQAGVNDLVYGKDISYYLFSFPIYTLLQRRLLITFLLLFAAVAFLYWLEKRVMSQQELQLQAGARWHLNILILLIFGIEIWDFTLQRYALLYTLNHEPLFFGPGFVEMNVLLPLIWICLFLLVATAVTLVAFIEKRVGLKVLGLVTACFLLALGARYSGFLPNTTQKYIVKPNAISREQAFIASSVESTLRAYKLDNVETRDFTPERIPTDVPIPKLKDILRNIPVWDGELLNDVYEQMQQLRTYYDFTSVDVSHYDVRGNNQQVFLAARELNPDELSAGARNWVNEHLSYTHGYGAVMTPAAQGGDESMTWFIRGIPMESDFGFEVEEPAIYYGQLENYRYAIAPNDAGEFDYPKGDANVISNYKGKGGVPLSGLYRKLIFAYYFGDRDIFFTTKTNADSKILFHRNIRERIRALTPYLLLDHDPYLVVTPERFYWIQDAYTTSDWYPNAAKFHSETGQFSYVRNSVKIVVDAYDGSVDYYLFDADDPVARAYDRMYPGVFKSKDSMPPGLESQVRYPQDLFNIQMEMYAKYHQTDPEVFYQQEDTWEFAAATHARGATSPKSYHLTLDLIDQGKFDFLLLAPMSPKGRSNLRALALAGSQHPNYGRIIIYNFPKGELVYGPSQVYALMNQDTKVAEQFTLWDQIGSQVEHGKMIILPIGKVVIYIQPVYLKSSGGLKIPELKRLVMTQGQIVVMEPSLEQAYSKLEERLKAEQERIEKRYTPYAPAPAAPAQPAPAPPSHPAPAAPQQPVPTVPEQPASPAPSEPAPAMPLLSAPETAPRTVPEATEPPDREAPPESAPTAPSRPAPEAPTPPATAQDVHDQDQGQGESRVGQPAEDGASANQPPGESKAP